MISYAPKMPTNLSLSSNLLAKTRALKINLPATLEQALEHELARVEAERWAKEIKTL
jgi:antitoxin CcdA